MADELLGYVAMRQRTTVNRRREVRAKNAVDGGVSMTSSSISMQANNDSQSNRSVKVGGTDEDK
jgi:hypothetical protein